MAATVGTLRKTVWLAAAALLILPLVAMRFTGGVNWGPGDFVAAAALLLGGAFIFDRASRAQRPRQQLAAIGIALLAGLLLVWAELAVGIAG